MEIINQFAQLAQNYLAANAHAAVYPTPEAITALQQFETPLQQESLDAEEVITMLDELGSPASVRSTGGRYFGFVIGGTLPAALSAKLLATVWDQNSAMQVSSPIAARLENVAGKWLLDLFNFPADAGFGFVTGDTMANFTALAAARHQVLKNAGWDAEANGLFGAPEIRIIVGDEVHVSILKALSMLGLGSNRIIRVPVDGQGCIIPSQIPKSDEPTIICAQAGNVNTGGFDDTATICQMRGANTWVHVDAAFGLWAAVSPTKKHLVNGIELADSWATDAHKWLNVPYDSGIVFVRDKAALRASMSGLNAAYLPTDTAREPFHYVPELSRAGRGIPVWAALKSLGKTGLADMIDRHCRQAVLFADLLTEAGYTILNEIVLNQALLYVGDAAQMQSVIKGIQQDGTCWCGGTVWQGKAAIRISVSGWCTTDDDIHRSAQAVIGVLKKLGIN